MTFKKCVAILLCLALCSSDGMAQAREQVILTPQAFIEQIRTYHPVAKIAGINVKIAEAELLSARGGFDPYVDVDASRKTFDGRNYYHYSNPEFKIPTPFAMEIKTGLENNGGNFINPEVSTGRTSYLGLEVPLAKGLLLDKRRAVLQQAKIFRRQSEQERLAVVNDLLFDAYAAYWHWAGYYRLNNLYSNFVDVANNRLRLVRIAYNNGDRAAIDTVEALAQLQSYQLQQSDALLQFNNAQLELANFLWLANDSPYIVPPNYAPDSLQFAADVALPELNQLLQQSASENPILRSNELKLAGLQVDRRLKFQNLLPTLNLNANLLNKDYYVLKGYDAMLLQNNYKWGIQFKLPLLLREGRGEYRKAQLKIKETDLANAQKRWQIETKILSYYNEMALLQQQLTTNESILTNNQSLLRNEELKFSQGESSLFLINTRETKVLELLEKQVALRVKFLKSRYAVEWAAGLLR